MNEMKISLKINRSYLPFQCSFWLSNCRRSSFLELRLAASQKNNSEKCLNWRWHYQGYNSQRTNALDYQSFLHCCNQHSWYHLLLHHHVRDDWQNSRKTVQYFLWPYLWKACVAEIMENMKSNHDMHHFIKIADQFNSILNNYQEYLNAVFRNEINFSIEIH